MSVVFQDYTTSANPRFRVQELIGESLRVRERREGIRINREEELEQLLALWAWTWDTRTGFPMSSVEGSFRGCALQER